MSGPKLSAYELEQLRKAELERIQREIVRIKALSLQDVQEAQRAQQWCDEERQRLEYQRQLLDASTLSSEEKQKIERNINSRIAQIQALKSLYSTVPQYVVASELDEARAEQTKISSQLAKCRKEKATYESGRATHEASLSAIADDLCKAVRSESYSLEKALANLPPRSTVEDEDDAEIQGEKAELLRRAQEIINNANATAEDRVRAVKAMSRINATNDERELHHIASLVIGEIERTLRKAAPLIEEYRQLLSTRNALALSLGKTDTEEPREYQNLRDLEYMIENLKAQIQMLEAQLLEKAEREEISRCIDMAMEDLGYAVIGKKKADATSSQIKLYEFSDNAGLQITQRQDGVVRIKIVGLANEDKKPTPVEQDALYDEQVDFCDEYDKIVEAFRKKGVIMRQGTQKRMAPDRQFSQYVNVKEYNPQYTAQDTTGSGTKRETSTSESERKRKPARKPKVISKQ